MQLKELVHQTIPSTNILPTLGQRTPDAATTVPAATAVSTTTTTPTQKISLPPISDILHTPIPSTTTPPPRQPHQQSLPPLNQLPPLSLASNNANNNYKYHDYYYSQQQQQQLERVSPNLPPYNYSQQHYQYQTSTPPNMLLRNNSYPSTSSSSSSIFNSPLSSPGTNNHNQKRKTRNNLPKEITYILLRWLNDHLNHPYPSSFEKNELMALTGLNQQQLSNWFINARRRKIKTLKEQKRLNF
ncbi:Homeobox protein TOS8 [Candida viswanathii]|uniref:Homeobox protein TOS8 n=1 Tax=Candida viswanathii TaxID=5486 RepID=A0A367YHZ8_9ASCO|nr:Homeobox protein TOS8 [Candida viswanathii]